MKTYAYSELASLKSIFHHHIRIPLLYLPHHCRLVVAQGYETCVKVVKKEEYCLENVKEESAKKL